MRIRHRYLTYNKHSKVIEAIRIILDKYNISYNYKEDLNCVIPSFRHTIEFNLHEDDPRFHLVKDEIDGYGIKPQIGTVYENSDVEKADWFIIGTGNYQYPQPEDDFGYLNTTFNLDNFCKLCGIGKVQNAPFRLKIIPKQQNNQFWGLHWEFESLFIREQTKNILEQEQVRKISFSQPMLHRKNISVERFYQLHINTILPGGFDSYNTTTITCKNNNEEGDNTDKDLHCCGRIKYHHPLVGGYLFERSIFNPEYDIVRSHEYFGSGGSANRLLIVSKRFKKIVERNKLKGLAFTPVAHERLNR